MWFQSQNRPRETSLIRGEKAHFSQTQPPTPTNFGGAGLKMTPQLRFPDFQSQKSRNINIPLQLLHVITGHQQWLSAAGDGPDRVEKCCCKDAVGGSGGPGSQGHGWYPCWEMPCVAPVLLGHRWQQGLSKSVAVTPISIT